MNYQWSWHVFQDMSGDGVTTYLQLLISGALTSIATAALATVISLCLGFSVGLARTSTNAVLRAVGAVYVEVFRDVPLLVQMFVWYFVVPELLPKSLGDGIKALANGPFLSASLALGLYTAARIGEQTRASILALPKGQFLAACALGLTRWQAARLIVLPQAMPLIVPPLTSELVNLVKNTSIGMTIGLMELTATAREMQETTFHTFEAFSAATLGYLLINCIVIVIMRVIAARTKQAQAHAPSPVLPTEVLS